MSVLELDYSDMSDIVDAANGLVSKAGELKWEMVFII